MLKEEYHKSRSVTSDTSFRQYQSDTGHHDVTESAIKLDFHYYCFRLLKMLHGW